MFSRRSLAGAALAMVIAMAPVALAAEKLNVLIIDGQHNHKWQETTPAIKELLLKTGRFSVDVATTPPKGAKTGWENFKPQFSKYNAVLLNYAGDAWPDEVNKSFEQYMQDGGGLVFYHAAVFAFPKWEAFNKMMGLGWRTADYGERITLDDSGKVIRTPKGEGPGGGHGPAHVFSVDTRMPDHPIMKGLPAKWEHVKDELYHGQRGPAENMTILASAFSKKEGKGSGANEPMVWTIPVGKGRSAVTLLGHDVPATTDPLAATILVRCCEWAATGEVTIPAK
jgi:hypothetical protein